MENLDIQISGQIQNSNFPIWKDSLLDQIKSINLELVTDDEFAIAEKNSKSLKKAEKVVQEAKIKALEQTQDIQSLFKALDEVAEEARQARLKLDRQIRVKKQKVKEALITDSINNVRNYIGSKPEVFNQLDNNKYIQRYQYEAQIKGKSTINSCLNSLNLLVETIKASVDIDCNQVIANYLIIKNLPPDDKILFQDINYLVTLPTKELKLTIDNRKTKLSEQTLKTSEQRLQKKALEAKKELEHIDNEALSDSPSEENSDYLISIELFSSKQEAANMARRIKDLLQDSSFLLDIRLSKKRDI